MTVIKVRKSVLRSVAVFFFLALPIMALSLVLSACNAPMGLGDPIDWEPPVLTLDGPTVRYVREGTTLTGTIKDNVKVDRVILRDTLTGQELFRAKLLPRDRWEIDLTFDESRNGDKILGELVGYDSFGNSGDTSIKGITLNIDLRPPFVDDIWISRTEIRKAYLEKIMDLQAMEESDPRGDWPLFVDMYQNGSFWIDAKISELETRIEDLILFVYDESHPDTPIFSRGIERIETTTTYNPRFLINETDILAAGNALWPGYTAAYEGGKRNYYRVEIEAVDNAQNRNFPMIDQLDYFCMWKTADMPKGRLDPIVGITDPITIPKGSTLPIQFFDDDVLDFAYAALFTMDQWNGIGYIAPDVRIPNGTTEEKRDWLTARLLGNLGHVYNWRYDKWRTEEGGEEIDKTSSPWKSNKVENIIPAGGVDDLLYFVQAGNAETDFGEYVLFSLVGDRKLTPHNTPGNSSTNASNLRRSLSWNVNVIDENAPLIIFDTENGCPEENTFPQELDQGKYFDIVGYTLRENSSGMNKVLRFRMAWIPFGLPGGADSYITDARAALKQPTPDDAYFRQHGIQWWNLDEDILHNYETVQIGDFDYIEQHFKKKFDVQGGYDDSKGEDTPYLYKNFTYLDPFTGEEVFENTTKLFIFYVVDNMGHEVYSQRYLLGNRIPPTLTVYDLTGRTDLLSLDPPDIYDSISEDPDSGGAITDVVRKAYQKKLDVYNAEITTYNTIRNSAANSLSPANEAAILEAYQRGATISYWATAGQAEGGLEVRAIKMEDVTSSVSGEDRPNGIGYFNKSPPSLSYTEYLPEVEQRTFRFTAIDALGNTNTIQRTVVISAAALLSEITTKTPSGTYGIGTEIILQARFSGTVKWTGDHPPLLNVRYNEGGTVQTLQIPTRTAKGEAVQFLEFLITVGLNDEDRIETMYKGKEGEVEGITDRPLTIPEGTKILDSDRDDYPAFIPGYSVGYEWLDEGGSLQRTKNITLDGIPPYVDGNITISGKTAYTADNNTYFKTDDIIEFTLPADDNIFTGGGGNPRLAFRVGSTNQFADWQRSADSGLSMVFRAIVATTWGDGAISDIRLNTTSGTIIDNVGNKLWVRDVGELSPTMTLQYTGSGTSTNGSFIIDQTPPIQPSPVRVNNNTPNATGTNNYNGTPILYINTTVPTANEPNGIDRTEYSLNNGLKWVTYPNQNTADNWTTIDGDDLRISGGEWILRTRHIDKAGNEGTPTTHTLSVNANFPRLERISAVQPNGIYTQGQALTFNLGFSAPVYTTTPSSITITLTNRGNAHSATEQTFNKTLPATTVGSAASPSSSITFAWNDIQNKEMLEGLYVSEVIYTALRDVYGNIGSTGSAGIGNEFLLTAGGNTCANLGAGLIVDCIAPLFDSSSPTLNTSTATTPAAGTVMNTTGDNYNRIITLSFNEAVQAGSGTITIKPHGAYFIPPVFENDTYYLEVRTGNRSSTIRSGYTKITGFYDVYNATPAGMRAYLTQGTSMTNLTLDARTGQSAGPYIKMTQGLKQGAGYSGNYTTDQADAEFNRANANGPNVVLAATNPYMVPDTATKWVLDYRYSIDNQQNTSIVSSTGTDPGLTETPANAPAVTNIRTALTAAKFRWQELDVTSSSVTINGNTVTITLPEALENGLEWDICYPAGTFTDLAGHNAPSMNYNGATIMGDTGTQWFVSNGVQVPVIRVNRKSFDARTSRWQITEEDTNNARNYAVPTDRGGPGGWGINDFNTVHYRIETETRNATLRYAPIQGNATNGSVWIGDDAANTPAAAAWGAVPNGGTVNWYTTTATRGTVVRPNLIRRAQANNSGQTWSVTDENNVNTTRSFTGPHNGFRSYNKDARQDDLTATSVTLNSTISSSVSSGTLNFTYRPTEARKDYVVALAAVSYDATVNESRRGYEGVFRSVVALLQQNNTLPLYVEGSNVKNGMPSIAGFPVRDAEEAGDRRYIKFFYRIDAADNSAGSNNYRFYWVSTEIVSDWYFIKFGNGGRHQESGEVNNYLTAGYGDLAFGYRVTPPTQN